MGQAMGGIGEKIGDGFGKVFGSMDKYATNSVDSSGNVVATGTPGANEVSDPSMGLSRGNLLARGALAGGLKGWGNQSKPQPQGGYVPVQFNAQNPQLDPSLTNPQGNTEEEQRRKAIFGY